MSLGQIFRIAIADTVMGMGTVFVVLLFIAFVIWLLGFIPKWEERRAREKAAVVPAEAAAQAPQAVPAAAAAQDDGELVAVITAAVMAYLESEAPGSSDGYVVRNIRRAAWRHTLSE